MSFGKERWELEKLIELCKKERKYCLKVEETLKEELEDAKTIVKGLVSVESIFALVEIVIYILNVKVFDS